MWRPSPGVKASRAREAAIGVKEGDALYLPPGAYCAADGENAANRPRICA